MEMLFLDLKQVTGCVQFRKIHYTVHFWYLHLYVCVCVCVCVTLYQKGGKQIAELKQYINYIKI